MIVGIDEVGYGAWAGPMLVAGTIIYTRSNIGYRESKAFKTIDDRIDYLDKLIKTGTTFDTCIAVISPEFIDENGLYRAEEYAVCMIRKYFGQHHYIIDGNKKFGADEAVVNGDKKYDSISFSSMIAKIARDYVMMTHELSDIYDWSNNKGYYTKKHRELVEKNGYSDFHRINRWGEVITDENEEVYVGYYASNWDKNGWIGTNSIIKLDSDEFYDSIKPPSYDCTRQNNK